jgi:hypothetical protein
VSRKSLSIGLAGLCFCMPSAYANDMAVACEFEILKQAHETLVYCGELIDSVSETRYEKLFWDFSSFVAANANAKKNSYNGSLEQIQRRLHQDGRDLVCKDPGYPLLRQAFFRYVSDEGMAEVGRLLSHPQNPFEGDCL